MTTSTIDWNWPGARWWRFDLHVHSPQSSDWRGDASDSPQKWVDAAVAAGLHAVALTDHNSAGWVDRVKAAADSRLVVFPGAEITTDSGAHLLVILPEDADGERVAGLLGACGVDLAHTHNAQARTPMSFLAVAELARKSGAIAIAAHVDGAAGIFDKLKDGALRNAIVASHLDAFEWKGVDSGERAKLDGTDPSYRRKGGSLAIVHSSDAHELAHIGSRFTCLKMARPSMEGLRLALMDPDLSVHPSDGSLSDPNTHANCVIEKLSVMRTKHIGNGTAFEVGFNPWLNAIIGGRGTGKSSLVEFIRIVARREGELPKSLRKSFDDLAKVPASKGDLGLLRKDERGESELQLTYRRDGARFRLRWNVSASVPAIEIESAPDVWESASGDVRERFPVRIFSQKQVFELAAEPGKLLEIIDDDPDVGAHEARSAMQREEGTYLQLRAQRRVLTARLGQESKVRGELDDVLRKIHLFEQAGHAEVLREFQRRTRQGEAVRAFRTEAEQQIQAVEKAARAIVPGALDRTLFDAALPADATALDHLGELQRRLTELGAEVVRCAEVASSDYKDWLAKLKDLSWANSVTSARDGYARLVEELKARGAGDSAEYGKLVQRRQGLEAALRQFDSERRTVDELDNQCGVVLGDYLAHRRELSRRRRTFLSALQAKVPDVRLELLSYGAREAAEQRLRELVGADDGKHTRDLGTFDPVDPMTGPETVLGALYPAAVTASDVGAAEAFERLLAGTKDKLATAAETQSREGLPYGAVFLKALQRLSPEQVDRLRLWWPEDLLRVSYRTRRNEDFKPIDQGSPGQKTSALLAFFLAYGDEPLVLDQPEDDLDNELIYDLLVQRLRHMKTRRQIIVVTHNPNVVVNGDAELIVPIAIHGARTMVSRAGTLQEIQVRDEICRVMEGGTDALKRRFRRLVEIRNE